MVEVVFLQMEKKKSLQEAISDWEKEDEEEGRKLWNIIKMKFWNF